MMFAVQVLYNLYATSVVTAAAFDAARVVAGGAATGDRRDAEADGRARFRALVGRYAARHVETLDFGESTDDVIVLHVRARNPSLLPGRPAAAAFGTIDRRIRVRVERFRASP
jgi:hypothetical protein